MQGQRVWGITGLVHAAALACLAYLVTRYPIAPLFTWTALFWLALGLIAGYSVIRSFGRGAVPFNISVGFTVSGAVIVLFNPLVAAFLITLSTLNERDFKRLRPPSWMLYNRSMFFVTATASALVFQSLPGPAPTAAQPGVLMARMVPTVLTYFILNTTLVHARVAACNHEPFLHTYPFKVRDLLFGYLFQSVISAVLVILVAFHLALASLVILPLWGIRFSLGKIVELRELNEQLVQSFADALDMRDHDTAGHTRRVATLARLLGAQLGLPHRDLDDIYAAGSLHDLGKIGIPDAILLKDGTLDRVEWAEMQKHPVLGASLLAPYRHLQRVTAIMRHHHERWDGRGYPDGLCGESIPFGARIIAVADTFLVITDGRKYRAARTIEEAIAEIQRCSGSQFDSRVVEAFLSMELEVMLKIIDAEESNEGEQLLGVTLPHKIGSKLRA